MVNYQNAKIYKVVFDNHEDMYVGSTTLPLYKRHSNHRSVAKYEHYESRRKSKFNNFMREGGLNSSSIVLVESFPCNSKEELFARERHWIELLNPSLNEKIPARTRQEYEQTAHAKELKKKHDADYRKKHYDRIVEYDKARNGCEARNARRRELYRLKKEVQVEKG